ncbi:response regulator [Pseudooceanicola sp. CBS1P-1]|uniref:Response regulator n=1 Tax=Pseudooceanicola albus TaxID=2692189 RepID=A0A6L7G956_9RHOB|nr:MULTISPECIES: response regulator [Pseudooceanicola]MBT9384336.1 response regulator [Pseudooceanicola endophyticus]MXN19926.1 response regulator [Pseudooceanicola albus]
MSDADFTVHLVDDDRDVRRALSRALLARGMPVQDHASAEAFLAAYDPARPACLILDYGLPGMSGLDLQAEIARREDILPIIFITGHGGVAEAVRAMRGGAIDFLEKPFRQAALMERIDTARSTALRLRAARDHQAAIAQRFARLTEREAEIVRQIFAHPAETSSKELARRLDISPRTVDHHRARILEKLNVASVSGLFGLVAELSGPGPLDQLIGTAAQATPGQGQGESA